MLEIELLSKFYNIGGQELKVIEHFSESIYYGELIALVGPSGAGKSTLMHIIGGLDTPTSGRVVFEGENIFNKNEEELNHYRGKYVGFVFQHYYLLDDFTALENIMLPGLILGESYSTIKDKALQLIENVGLKDRTNHYPKELSGGEQQRIAVARALINSPKIILADEPTGNLDKNNSKLVLNILKKLSNQSVAVVIVTHDEEIALDCSRVIRLNKI